MFVQVIEGKTSRPEELRDRLGIWERDLMPGAIGYQGSTGGCTADGDCILVVRFRDAEAAELNSRRPEQAAWWEETEQLFDGPPTFHDTEDVHVMQHGSLDESHFVQVMEGHVADRERADDAERRSEPMLVEARPDLLGSVTAYHGDDEFTEVAYFTTEKEARAAETADMAPELADSFREFQQVWQVDRYLDIRDPWLISG